MHRLRNVMREALIGPCEISRTSSVSVRAVNPAVCAGCMMRTSMFGQRDNRVMTTNSVETLQELPPQPPGPVLLHARHCPYEAPSSPNHAILAGEYGHQTLRSTEFPLDTDAR